MSCTPGLNQLVFKSEPVPPVSDPNWAESKPHSTSRLPSSFGHPSDQDYALDQRLLRHPTPRQSNTHSHAMTRFSFGDFLNQDNPRGRGRGRGRGGSRGGGGRGGGPSRGGGGGRGGRGGFDSSRGRGAGRTVRGGHFGADYSAVALDYSKLSTRRYTKFERAWPRGGADGSERAALRTGRGAGQA